MEKLVAMVTRGLAASGASTQISHPFCLNFTSRKFPCRISGSITQVGKQPQRGASLRLQLAHGGIWLSGSHLDSFLLFLKWKIFSSGHGLERPGQEGDGTNLVTPAPHVLWGVCPWSPWTQDLGTTRLLLPDRKTRSTDILGVNLNHNYMTDFLFFSRKDLGFGRGMGIASRAVFTELRGPWGRGVA